jgi:hypothetical protein
MESAKYWDNRYSSGGTSGYGSYGEQLQKKLKWLVPLDFNTVTEVGCGNFNFGMNLLKRHPAQYIGMDVSEVILKKNREWFPEHIWLPASQQIPPADLLLCIDVIFHVDNQQELLRRLESSWTKYLAITAYEYDQVNGLAPHVHIRKFDPSRFGTPIIREQIEADGNLMFFLWKK